MACLDRRRFEKLLELTGTTLEWNSTLQDVKGELSASEMGPLLITWADMMHSLDLPALPGTRARSSS